MEAPKYNITFDYGKATISRLASALSRANETGAEVKEEFEDLYRAVNENVMTSGSSDSIYKRLAKSYTTVSKA